MSLIQNLKPKACYEVFVVDKETAKEALKGIIKYLGMGFHPDTLGSQYVHISIENRTFEDFEAENLDKNIRAIELYLDIYQETFDLWHEFGMITTEEYVDLC
jgi:hypothetical protein